MIGAVIKDHDETPDRSPLDVSGRQNGAEVQPRSPHNALSPPGGHGHHWRSSAAIRRGYDALSTRTLDRDIAAAAGLAAIASFLPFYSYELTGDAAASCSAFSDGGWAYEIGFCSRSDVSAWHATYAAVGVLLVLIPAFAVVAVGYATTFQHPNVVRLIAACMIALGVVSLVYAAFSIPNWSPDGPNRREFDAVVTDQRAYDAVISNTAGWGCYVLVFVGIALVALVLVRGRLGARGRA